MTKVNLNYASRTDLLEKVCLTKIHAWQNDWQTVNEHRGRAYLLVPDSLKLKLEKSYLKTYPEDSLLLADVLSFESLGKKIINFSKANSAKDFFLPPPLQRIFLKNTLTFLKTELESAKIPRSAESEIREICFNDELWCFTLDSQFFRKKLTQVYLDTLLESFTFIRSVGLDNLFLPYKNSPHSYKDEIISTVSSLPKELDFAKNLAKLTTELSDVIKLVQLYLFFQAYLKAEGYLADYDLLSVATEILKNPSAFSLPVKEFFQDSTFFIYGFAYSRHLTAQEWNFVQSLLSLARRVEFFLLKENAELPATFARHLDLNSAFSISRYWSEKIKKFCSSTVAEHYFGMNNIPESLLPPSKAQASDFLPQTSYLYNVDDTLDLSEQTAKIIYEMIKDKKCRLDELSLVCLLSDIETEKLVKELRTNGLKIYQSEKITFRTTIIYNFCELLSRLLQGILKFNIPENILQEFITHPFLHKGKDFWQTQKLKAILKDLLYYEEVNNYYKLTNLLKKIVELHQQPDSLADRNLPKHLEDFLLNYSLDEVVRLNAIFNKIYQMATSATEQSWQNHLLNFTNFLLDTTMAEYLAARINEEATRGGEETAYFYQKQWQILGKVLENLGKVNFSTSISFEDFLKTFLLLAEEFLVKEIPRYENAIYLADLREVLEENRPNCIIIGANATNFPYLYSPDATHLEKFKQVCQTFFVRKEDFSLNNHQIGCLKVPYPAKDKQLIINQNIIFYNLLTQSNQSLIFINNTNDPFPLKYKNKLQALYNDILGQQQTSFQQIDIFGEKNNFSLKNIQRFEIWQNLVKDSHPSRATLTEGENTPKSAEEYAANFVRWLLLPNWQITLSASKLEEYRKSPFFYFLKHILGMQEYKIREKKHDVSGSLLHSTFEQLMRDYFLNNKKPPFLAFLPDKEKFYQEVNRTTIYQNLNLNYKSIKEQLEAYLKKQVEAEKQYYIFQNKSVLNNNLRLLSRNLTWDLCKSFLQLHTEYQESGLIYQPRLFEERFSLDLPLASNEFFLPQTLLERPYLSKIKLNLRGIIDRIDYISSKDKEVGFRIIDYKSGKQAIDREKLACGLNLQMPLYLYAYEKMLNQTTTPNLRGLDCAYIKLTQNISLTEDKKTFFQKYSRDLWKNELKLSNSADLSADLEQGDFELWERFYMQAQKQEAIGLEFVKESVLGLLENKFTPYLRVIAETENSNETEETETGKETLPGNETEDTTLLNKDFMYHKLLPFCAPFLVENGIEYLSSQRQGDLEQDAND